MNEKEAFAYLVDKQQQLVQRIGAIEADFRTGRPQDFAEQASESENDETLQEILLQAKFELQQVELAIAAIDNDSYGICSQCQAPIASERLAALPYTQTCINCTE